MQKLSQIKQARFLKRTLGTRVAAGFLRNRGWSIEAAVLIVATNLYK